MSSFLAFTYNIVKDACSYVDARVDNLKLRSIKGLSEGTSSLAGVLLLVLVVILLCRKRLFKDNFVSMYTDVFYQKENKPLGLRDQETLDDAIIQTEMRANECFSTESMSEDLLTMLLRFLLKKRK